MTQTRTDIHEQVSQRYGQIAESGGSCCGSPGDSGGLGILDHAEAIGYDRGELQSLP